LERRKEYDYCTPGETGTLKREQWERLESSHLRKTSHEKRRPSTALRRRKGGTTVGYSGRTGLRREQC
jgi:hypothetical protein